MSDTIEKKIKRGKESWNFFYLIFTLLIAVAIFVTSILPINNWAYKFFIFVVSFLVLFWACLISVWWQNKLIGLKIKLEETWREL